MERRDPPYRRRSRRHEQGLPLSLRCPRPAGGPGLRTRCAGCLRRPRAAPRQWCARDAAV